MRVDDVDDDDDDDQPDVHTLLVVVLWIVVTSFELESNTALLL